MTQTTTGADQRSLVRQLIEACVLGDDNVAGSLVTEDVIGWSPTLNVHSRKELLAEFADRQSAFSSVDLTVTRMDATRDRVAAEWRMSATFTGPLEIEDMTIPPSGDRVTLAGATFADLRGDRICEFHHYFDDAALLEQLLALE